MSHQNSNHQIAAATSQESGQIAAVTSHESSFFPCLTASATGEVHLTDAHIDGTLIDKSSGLFFIGMYHQCYF